MSFTSLSSARLDLIPINREHESDLHRLHTDPRIVSSLFRDCPPLIKDTRDRLDTYLEGWRRDGFGFWMVFERKPEGMALAGRAGLRRFNNGQDIEFGHCVLSTMSGRGIAVEAGHTIIRHAFDVLRVSKLVAVVMPKNAPGIRAILKLGFQFVDEKDHGGERKLFFERHAGATFGNKTHTP